MIKLLRKIKVIVMQRRIFLKRSVSFTAGGISLGFLPSSVNALGNSAGLKSFDERDRVLMRLISGIMIPETTSKGAVGTMSDEKALEILTYCYTRAFTTEVIQLLSKLNKSSERKNKRPAALLAENELTDLLENLDSATSPFDVKDQQIFRELKQLVVYCFCTSQKGANQELTYLAVPGGYTGSIPYSSVGSAYSSKAYY